jgi:CRISPR-associated protein Cmr4
MQSSFYYLHALSALHVGSGQGAGVIDLPIVREKATHLPYVPGSSLKGVLREELRPGNGGSRALSMDDWEALFGPRQVQDDTGFAGALAIGDACVAPAGAVASRDLCLTICPFILARY